MGFEDHENLGSRNLDVKEVGLKITTEIEYEKVARKVGLNSEVGLNKWSIIHHYLYGVKQKCAKLKVQSLRVSHSRIRN